MEERAKAFVNYRHFIAIRAKYFFQMMLSQRGYNGKMVFDHGNESLGLQVGLFLYLFFFSVWPGFQYSQAIFLTRLSSEKKGQIWSLCVLRSMRWTETKGESWLRIHQQLFHEPSHVMGQRKLRFLSKGARVLSNWKALYYCYFRLA